MPTGNVLAFALASAVLIAIPGPSVLFTVSRALTIGRRGALLTVLGNAAGVYVQVLLVALGLGAAISRSVAVFTVLKLAGAAYLAYLGVQAIRHRHALAAARTAPVTRRGTVRVLRDGFVVGATNPKTVIFFVAATPQFVDRPAGGVGLQIAVLGLAFVLVALVLDSLWALAAGAARTWFASSPRRMAHITAGGGAAMVGLGVKLAVSGRSD
jgi:threonine/homoserine/homoserine lactone efflux protein